METEDGTRGSEEDCGGWSGVISRFLFFAIISHTIHAGMAALTGTVDHAPSGK